MAEAAFVLAWLLGAVFLASGVGKLLAIGPFASTVEAVGKMFFASTSRVVVIAAAAFTITTEIFLAALFLGGLLPMVRDILAIAVLVFFSGIGAAAIKRGAHIDCRCFGASGETLGLRTLMRALILALIASGLLALDTLSDGDWAPAGGVEWISALTTVAGALLLGVWISNVDVVVRLARERRHERLVQAARVTPSDRSAGVATDMEGVA
jgi:hypothetical protein